MVFIFFIWLKLNLDIIIDLITWKAATAKAITLNQTPIHTLHCKKSIPKLSANPKSAVSYSKMGPVKPDFKD